MKSVMINKGSVRIERMASIEVTYQGKHATASTVLARRARGSMRNIKTIIKLRAHLSCAAAAKGLSQGNLFQEMPDAA